MADAAPHSHVIADRYLTSPAALAAHPFGPVDALDTHSGRGAQVRIVFVDAAWDESGLADAVARWCGIGCSEVCGVLDFGRHADRWFLVLPPSLGLPVERWRMLRRPTAEDAARLTLAFGRLTERVAAAGFSPDAASVADVAVGPGPTPFLERPLLPPASDHAPVPGGDGQRVLAAVCDAALGSLEPPPGLREWVERARRGGHAGLTECLDDLERCGVSVNARESAASESPPGLERLFDEQFDLDGPALGDDHGRRRRLLAGVPVVTIVILAVSAVLGHGAHQSPASTEPGPAAQRTTAVVSTPARHPRRAPSTPVHVKVPHRHRAARIRRHRRPAPAATAATPSTTAPTTPAPPLATTAGDAGAAGGAVDLPAPGGTTLPAPRAHHLP